MKSASRLGLPAPLRVGFLDVGSAYEAASVYISILSECVAYPGSNRLLFGLFPWLCKRALLLSWEWLFQPHLVRITDCRLILGCLPLLRKFYRPIGRAGRYRAGRRIRQAAPCHQVRLRPRA